MSKLAPARILLCRPSGGLNDVLCQIGKCRLYATRFDRHLIVDFGSDQFLESFFSLLAVAPGVSGFAFSPSRDELESLDLKSTYPAELSGRLNNYSSSSRPGHPRSWHFDKDTGARLTFDFSKDYEEEVLLHHAGGGGTKSFSAIQLFQISDSAVEAVREILSVLPSSYDAAHVRATDYQTDYQDFLARVDRKAKNKALFLATDNPRVIEVARLTLRHREVLSLPPANLEHGLPIHRNIANLGETATQTAALNLLAELVAVANAERFYYTSISERVRQLRKRFSGLSLLLAFLVQERNAARVFGRELISQGNGQALYLDSYWSKLGHSASKALFRLKRLV